MAAQSYVMSAYPTPRLLPMGDAAWTLELGAQVDADVNARCAAIAQALEQRQRAGGLQGVRDIVPTFRSVTVLFDPLQANAQALGETLVH